MKRLHESRLRRHAFLDVCGAVVIRNLSLDQSCSICDSNTYCEIIYEGMVIFRSGLVMESFNPTWTLRSREQVGLPATCMSSIDDWNIYDQPFRIKVYAVDKDQAGYVDPFPYHHAEEPSGKKRVVLDKTFFLRDATGLDMCVTDMPRMQAQQLGPDSLFLGMHVKSLPIGLDVKNAFLGESKRHGGESSNLYLFKVNATTKGRDREEGDGQQQPQRIGSEQELRELLGSERYDRLVGLVKQVADVTATLATCEERAQTCLTSRVEKLNAMQLMQRKRIKMLERERDQLKIRCNQLKELVMRKENSIQGRLINVKDCATEIQDKAKERNQALKTAIAESSSSFKREMCFVRSHRINLLKGLMDIYPLQERYTEGGPWIYTIRGLRLPNAQMLHLAMLNAYEEEQTSTALGYLAHFVNLACKYLDIPLRYIPLPHSSSSTICDPLVISAETPHEPLARYQTTQYGTSSTSFPQYIFGSASGRLGRANAQRALSIGSYPLYWKGLNKSARPKFQYSVELLARDVGLLQFVHYFRENGVLVNTAQHQHHMIALLQQVLKDYSV